AIAFHRERKELVAHDSPRAVIPYDGDRVRHAAMHRAETDVEMIAEDVATVVAGVHHVEALVHELRDRIERGFTAVVLAGIKVLLRSSAAAGRWRRRSVWRTRGARSGFHRSSGATEEERRSGDADPRHH